MREEFKCAGCGTWYDSGENDECPFCENENVSDTRDVNGGTERAEEGTQGGSL